MMTWNARAAMGLVLGAAIGLCAAGVNAAPMVWDNSDATFVWGDFVESSAGFDITKSPTDNAASGIGPLYYVRQWSTPTDPMWELISPPSGWSVVVEDRSVEIPGNSPTMQTRTRVVKPLADGDMVGATQDFTRTIYAFTRLHSQTSGTLADIGRRPVMGIRLRIGGNYHYGYIVLQLRSESATSVATYQPIAWGYESTPDTPIEIVSPDEDCDDDGDVNGDGETDLDDLQELLFAYGQTTDPGEGADTNFDGIVDLADLQNVLFGLGTACP